VVLSLVIQTTRGKRDVRAVALFIGDVAASLHAAIEGMDGRWLLLAPDCSVEPGTPEELLHAACAAAA